MPSESCTLLIATRFHDHMEFPGSKLSKPIRRTIFVVFFVLFFLISPAIIMYTSGYRYDWRRGLLRETGAVNIDIEPKTAEVFLNNVKIKSKMPVRLSDLIPGKYNIRVTAPGYYEWQKDVDVKSKQTVYVKEITMLQKKEPELFLQGEIITAKISFDDTYLAYLEKKNNLLEVQIKNIVQNTEPVTVYRLPASKEGYTISWAPTGNYILLNELAPPYETMVIIDANHPEKQTDLIKKLKFAVDKFQWKDSGEPELYFSTKLRIMSVLPSTEQNFILTKNTFIDWFVENGQLWAIEQNTSTKKISVTKDAIGFKSTFIPETVLSESEQNLQFLSAKNDHVLLKKTDKSEVVFFIKDKKYTFNGEKFSISKYNDWWIIWTPWEIWTYSRGEEPNLLNRSGQQLDEVIPLDKYNTLALVWADKTTALYPYYLVTHDIINTQAISTSADTKSKIIYFIADIDEKKGVWKLSY